ncbi:hypothetical protein K523DRAFT_304485 [Schizophyllum commune Tattone D]|nr:hypothetical protein K523DRAFT_304485 [Schizophyllum commune Tattone D]
MSVKLETAVEAEKWRRASSAASPSPSPSPLYTDILGAPPMFHYYNHPPAPAPSTPSSTSNLRPSTNPDLLFTSSPTSTPPPLPSDHKSPKRYTYTHLPPFIAHQLAEIWTADRRLPTPESRKRWALARDVDPVRVHNWWYRRKKVAKGLGVVIPEGNYELGVGDPVGEKERWEREREEALSRIERERQERQDKDERERVEKEAREEEERKQREEADAMEKREEKTGLRALGKENMKGGKRKTWASTEDTDDSPAQKRVKTVQRKDSVASSRKDSILNTRRDSAASARKASLRPPKSTMSLRSTQSKTAPSTTSTTVTSTKSKIAPLQPRPHMRLTRRNRPKEWQEWADDDDCAKEEVKDEDVPDTESHAPGEGEREGCDDLAASDVVLHPELPALADNLVLPTCAGFTTDDMYQLASRDRMPFLCAVCAEPAPSFPIDFDPSHDHTGFDSSLGEIDCDTLPNNTDSGTVLADTQPDALLGEAVLDASLALFNKMLDNPTLYDEMIPPEDRITMADSLLSHANDSGFDSAHNSGFAANPRFTCISLRQSWISRPTISYDLTDANFAAPAFAMDALPHARPNESYPHDRAHIHLDGDAYTRDGFRVAPLLQVVDRYASYSPIPMDASSPTSIFSFVSSDPCKLDPATVYPSSPASSRSSSPSDSCRSSPVASRWSNLSGPRPAIRTTVDSPATSPAVSASDVARPRDLADITNVARAGSNSLTSSVALSTAPLDSGLVKLHPNLKKSSSSIVSRPLPSAHPSLSAGSLLKCRSLPTRAPLRIIEIIDAVVESPRAMVEPLRDIQAPRPTRPYGGVRRLEVQAMTYQGAHTSTTTTLSSTTRTASSLSSSLVPRMSWLLDAAVQALTGSR